MLTEVDEIHSEFIKENWRELNYDWGYPATDDDGGEYLFIQEDGGGKRRWSEYMTVVTQVPDGRYVQWGYDQGLTENQDSEFGEIDGYVERKVETVTTEHVYFV